MPEFLKKISKKAGASPGTLVHIGEQRMDKVHITVMDYGPDQFGEYEHKTIEDIFHYRDSPGTAWININGIHDMELIQKIGNHFNIHPLTLEDIVNTGQRPKAEDFENYVYLVTKMLYFQDEENEIRSDQISLIVAENVLISFQEAKNDVFAPVRERIRKSKGRIRKSGCDYLAYTLLDTVVDNYFFVLEKMGNRIEHLEEALSNQPTPDTLKNIHEIKRVLIYLRKQVWPIRELINKITKGDFSLISESSVVFYKDVYDHIIQVMDTIESYRDVLSSMQDFNHHFWSPSISNSKYIQIRSAAGDRKIELSAEEQNKGV